DDVGVIEMRPVGIASAPAAGRRRWLGWIAVDPGVHIVTVELLAPQHAGKGLTLDLAEIGGAAGIGERTEEFVSFGYPIAEDLIEIVECPVAVRETQADHLGLAGPKLHVVTGGGLGSDLARIHRAPATVHYVVVDPVFDIRTQARCAENPREIRLVFGK